MVIIIVLKYNEMFAFQVDEATLDSFYNLWCFFLDNYKKKKNTGNAAFVFILNSVFFFFFTLLLLKMWKYENIIND